MKTNKIFGFCYLFSGVVFLTLAHPVSAQRLRLVLGTYECTTNAQCDSDTEYCDIDEHVCQKLPEYPECEERDPAEVCPKPAEGCNSNTDCTGGEKCLNRTCVECTGDADCPDAHFCIDNTCRPGCTKNEDCTDPEAPRCYAELGVCLPCPETAPLYDPATHTCTTACETNDDCPTDQAPFCRQGEGPDGKGKCGCPDKSTYNADWQACAYTKHAYLYGGKGRGDKGYLWTGGGKDGNTPFQEADYVMIALDCNYVGYVFYYKNGGEYARNACGVTYTYNKGDTFHFKLSNWTKKQESSASAYISFIYKDQFKPFTGEECTGDQPIMSADGRCIGCSSLTDGKKVTSPQDCFKCDAGKWFTAHSSKTATDNVCRPCVSGNSWYYADQEQCLKCPNRFHRAYDTGCIDCSYTGTVNNVTKEECTRCPDRRWVETNATTHLGNCYLCAKGAEVDASGGVCSVCDADNPIELVNIQSNGCTNCDNLKNGTQVASKEECHKCEDRKWFTAKSSTTDTTNFICRLCSSGNDYYYADESECSSCGNRVWRSNDHRCFDCAYTGSLGSFTEEECTTCENRFFSKAGNCLPCTYSSEVTTTLEACQKCSNRYWIENISEDGYGSCKVCPSGAKATADGLSCECSDDQVKLSDGKCYSCDQMSNGISVNTDNVEISQQRCLACNYVYLGYNNKCYDCFSDSTISYTTKEECDSCEADRYWVETNATTHLGNCLNCPTGTTTDGTGYNCKCDMDNPIALNSTNTNGCISCEALTDGKRVASEEDCHRCEAGLWYAVVNSITNPTEIRCRECESGNNYYTSTKKECESCDNTFWRSNDSKCFNCSFSSYITKTTPQECHACGNRLVAKNTYCYPCTAGSLTTTLAECKRCPNRYWTANTSGDGYGTCKVCPSGSAINNGTACGCTKSTEVATADGKCVLCSALTEGTAVEDSSQCRKCSGWIPSKENKCYKCDSQYIFNVSKLECSRCGNHLWRSSDSTCYNCSYPYKMYDTTKEECDSCPGRIWTETDSKKGLGFCLPAE